LFLFPRAVADKAARRYSAAKVANVREYRIDEVVRKFAAYENNFTMAFTPSAGAQNTPVGTPKFVV
jgi:hypothetical protein